MTYTGRSRKKRSVTFRPCSKAVFFFCLAAVVIAVVTLVLIRSNVKKGEAVKASEAQSVHPSAVIEYPPVSEEPVYTCTDAVPVETLHINSAADNTPNNNGYVESEREKLIYSYVQALPEYYDGDPKWAGDWCHISAGGQEFVYFGCGICCLSNIVSTFRSEPVTPDIVYYQAKETAAYRPESGIGAMSWSQLKIMCEQYGLDVRLNTKPADYADFQNSIECSEAAIVLVSKNNDPKLWWYTNGHYVNLWEYDRTTDTVFLSDASGLFNRARVSLRDIYNALKTSSSAQYLTAIPVPDNDPGF